jgi:hypothetical protein
LNDSTNGFSHGDPGSMNATPVRLNRHQSRSALEVISALRMGAALPNEPVEHVNDLVGVDPTLGLHRERLAGELVDHVEQLHRPPVLRDVELEVQRPDVIRALGTQPVTRHGRLADTLAFAALGRHPQALLAPQPLRPLAIHRPALIEQMLMRAAIPPPRPPAGEPPQLRSQRRILRRDERLRSLR